MSLSTSHDKTGENKSQCHCKICQPYRRKHLLDKKIEVARKDKIDIACTCFEAKFGRIRSRDSFFPLRPFRPHILLLRMRGIAPTTFALRQNSGGPRCHSDLSKWSLFVTSSAE